MTCNLLQTVCGTVDASVMCLFNTDLKGSCSVTSSSIYTVHTWSLPWTGGKDRCLDVGNTQALEPDRSVLNPSLPFTSLWSQSLMWVWWDISPWPPVNIHYLCFAGDSHDCDASWLLTFTASLNSTVRSWPGALALLKKGHLISWSVFDEWPMFLSNAWGQAE